MGKIVITKSLYPFVRFNSDDAIVQRLSKPSKNGQRGIVNLSDESNYVPHVIVNFLKDNPDKIYNYANLLKKFKIL